MTPPNFSIERAVGIDDIDALHEALYARIARCMHADDHSFPAEYDKLVADLESDFECEEAWMEEIEFSALQPHLEQHARILSALHHAQSHALEGRLYQAREALRLLPEWLDFHILTMDTSLAVAIRMALDTAHLRPSHLAGLRHEPQPLPRSGAT